MTNIQGRIIKVHKPVWTYTIKVHWIPNEDGSYTVQLTYADGTPLTKEEALEVYQQMGLNKE